MPFRIKVTLYLLGGLLLLPLLGPLLVPIPPLADTTTALQLADPDSLFVQLGELAVHYKEQGAGEPVFILLHGFGASLFSWREVMAPLAAYGRVIAFDRPAFGLTNRLLPGEWSENPYTPEAQVRLVVALLDALGASRAILVGNSAGGTVAVQVALAHPERVAGLVLVGAAIYAGGGAPAWVRPLLNTPQLNRIGPLISRQLGGEAGENLIRAAWFDPTQITPESWEGYRKPLRVENWDRALWELTKASRELRLGDRLGAIDVPTLVLSGAEDRIVPLEQSQRLAQEIPGASLAVLPRCGHVPQEECSLVFMEAVSAWLAAQRF